MISASIFTPMLLASDDGFICFLMGAGAILLAWIWNSSGSSTENPRGDFQIRARETTRGDKGELRVIVIEALGRLPVSTTCEVDFVIRALDVTDPAKEKPVHCILQNFQEPGTTLFRSYKRGTWIRPGDAIIDWCEIGVAPVDCLMTSKSGQRELKFYGLTVRRAGESTKTEEMSPVAIAFCKLPVRLNCIGYEEQEEKHIESMLLSVKLGIAVAFADGDLKPRESRVIEDWSAERIKELPSHAQQGAKDKLDRAILEFSERAKAGSLEASSPAQELRGWPVNGVKIRALELCVRVMTADGVTDPKEWEAVSRIGDLLGVSYDDLRNLTDKHPARMTTQAGSDELTDEQIAGIQPGLKDEEARKEIRRLFGIYNARLTVEKDPEKRALYQRKLEALARLRKSDEPTDEQIAGIQPGLKDEELRKEIRRLSDIYNARLTVEKDPEKRALYQRKLEALERLRKKHG